jgi:adenine/guanine phosphoribosyltransferase-like PRPP-binding protein
MLGRSSVYDSAHRVRDSHVIDYLCAVDHNWRALAVRAAIENLTPVAHQFDAIAVRGMSGATVGSILAHLLGKDLIIVRKPNVSDHSIESVEGPLSRDPLARYLIVDDFEVSGETIRAIKEAIGKQAAYVGYYLYREEELALERDVQVEQAREEAIRDSMLPRLFTADWPDGFFPTSF